MTTPAYELRSFVERIIPLLEGVDKDYVISGFALIIAGICAREKKSDRVFHKSQKVIDNAYLLVKEAVKEDGNDVPR